ncbi:MAG: carbohydrate kinase [Clostridiaceae bacterium]|nr:carbohydrate kinase [Clostridiaceae bacterium]
MFDVVALGESLIDFTPSGYNNAGNMLFARNPGGAPANVLAMNSKLGGKTAFIGMVGRDDFGEFLSQTMKKAGIDCRGLRYSDSIPTTLAFVHLNNKGDRSFSFYRKPGADIMLTWDDVDKTLLENCRIFHFGGVSLTDEPVCTATFEAVKFAKKHGALISYDPNYRPLLWESEETAIQHLKRMLEYTDILKVSQEEMEMLTGENSVEKGAEILYNCGISVVTVTLGPDGAYYYTKGGRGFSKAFPVKTIDTTGAGDAFLGTLHYYLSGKSLDEINSLDDVKWQHIMKLCNAAGSLTTTAYGAIPAMPGMKEIQECI